MRLYNIYFLCKKCITTFETVKTTARDSNNRSHWIEQWNEYKNALLVVRQIPMFAQSVDELYEGIPVFVREKDRPEIDSDTKNRFINRNSKIVSKMNTIIELYESMGLKENTGGIDIKLPPCTDLQEYISYLKEIEFIFYKCPLMICENETLRLESVDVGSKWIKLVVAVAAGTAITFNTLSNAAALVDKALTLESHYVTIQQQKEMLQAMKNKNEIVEEQLAIFETLKQTYRDQAVEELEDEIRKIEAPDERDTVGVALDKLCGLLEKGAEIYASLDSPQEVQAVFPQLEESYELTGDILKYIEDKRNIEE